MTNGSLRGCQKLRLDIGFGFRLSGCLRQTLCGCEIFQVCLGGLLFFLWKCSICMMLPFGFLCSLLLVKRR